jgi:thioredoxin 2
MSDKIHVVCGHCDSVVGLPADRRGDAPHCPGCHFALFEGKPIALTTASFERHLSRNDLPIVVDFWAPWCAPCRAMAPIYDAAARKFERQIRFGKLNTDDETAPAEQHHVRSLPTLVLFRGGREVARQSGALSATQLSSWLQAALDSSQQGAAARAAHG